MADCCKCWVVRDGRLAECPRPWRLFETAVSLHNHTSHSLENLAALNRVVRFRFMRPLAGTLQRSFGLDGVADFDYRLLRYHPPHAPAEVFEMERAAARRLGIPGFLFAVTDHDEVSGGLELPPDETVGIGVELSLPFQGHLFHLGITGLKRATAVETHRTLQDAARRGAAGDVFDLLDASGCLVVLNHPLLDWSGRDAREAVPALDLLRRHGRSIHALEFNGMRRWDENAAVLELARAAAKPVVGGGDSHMLAAASAISAVPSARTYAEFAGLAKSGAAATLVTQNYFAPLNWKLFLRVLYFMASYRRIGSYAGRPAAEIAAGRLVLLDPIGAASRAFLGLVSTLRLLR